MTKWVSEWVQEWGNEWMNENNVVWNKTVNN
jgi:hypothetical protein